MKYWDKAWSLVSQCTPVSPACTNCWLQAIDRRFGKEWNGNISMMSDRLDTPLKTRKPTVFAVWSDLYHEQVDPRFVHQAFNVIQKCQQHTFLICTKRPERIKEISYSELFRSDTRWNNLYLGTTVENQEMADLRLTDEFCNLPFKKFLSVEPMLSPIKIPVEKLKHFSCVIAGCESGAGARETKNEWIEDLLIQCDKVGVTGWVKQWRSAEGKLRTPENDKILPWRSNEA